MKKITAYLQTHGNNITEKEKLTVQKEKGKLSDIFV